MTTTTFTPGKTYTFGWIGDSELKSEITVTRRTAKTIWFMYNGTEVSKRVDVYNGVERVYPTGKYSMAPTCKASAEVVEEVVDVQAIKENAAKEDIALVEDKGSCYITDTAYGNLELSFENGMYRAWSIGTYNFEKTSFKTSNRELFITFLSSAYIVVPERKKEQQEVVSVAKIEVTSSDDTLLNNRSFYSVSSFNTSASTAKVRGGQKTYITITFTNGDTYNLRYDLQDYTTISLIDRVVLYIDNITADDCPGWAKLSEDQIAKHLEIKQWMLNSK